MTTYATRRAGLRPATNRPNCDGDDINDLEGGLLTATPGGDLDSEGYGDHLASATTTGWNGDVLRHPNPMQDPRPS